MLSPRKLALGVAALLVAAAAVGIVLIASSGSSHPARTMVRASQRNVDIGAFPVKHTNGRRVDARLPHVIAEPQISPRLVHRFGSVTSPVNGEIFSSTTGTWTGNPVPPYGYQWLDCNTSGAIASCVQIANATSSTYTLVSSDVGHTIRVAVTATNPYGFSTQDSAATGVVAASAASSPQITVAPAVTGTATQGQSLATTNGTWSGSPTSYAYQWQDCDAAGSCTNITGATSSTYTLAAADVSQFVRATVTATNGTGSGSAFSNVTVAVTASGGNTGSAGTWNGTQETGAPTTSCNLYASTTGSDANNGTASDNAHAFLTVAHLAGALTSGQVGCLEAGTYSVGAWTDSTANTTITAAPGVAVVVDGGPDLTGANITLSYLNIQLSTLYTVPLPCTGQTTAAQPLFVDGNGDTLEHDNIFDKASLTALQHYTAVAVGRNRTPPDQLTGAVIRYSRIHDYGAGCANDDGIDSKYGANGQFYGNWIYSDNASAGAIQFFSGNPQAHNNHAYANVMDHVGEGFVLFEEGPGYSSNTTDHNVVTNTTTGAGFATNDADATNTFTTSDGFTLAGTWPCGSCGSITVSGNLNEDPSYTNGAAHDYRVNDANLASWGLWDGDNGVAPLAATGGTWNGSQETGAASTVCDYYVSPTGSDANTGTGPGNSQAWQHVDKLGSSSNHGLPASFPAGKTACLESGSYTVTSPLSLNQSNDTITAAPGAAATINGWIIINNDGTGSNQTISYLNINQNYEPNLSTFEPAAICPSTTLTLEQEEVDGNHDSIIHDNLYQTDATGNTANKTSDLGVGWNVANNANHSATGVTIAYNRLHDYGNTCGHGHALYVAGVDHSSIYDNWIYGDPSGGAGIQFYDGASADPSSGIVGPHDIQAYSNVMDNVEVGYLLFGENSAYAHISMDHSIYHNVGDDGTRETQHLVRSVIAANTGIVNNNISFTNSDGTAIVGSWPCNLSSGSCGSPFTVIQSGLITSDPQFADPSYTTSHDYRVAASSPAAGWGMWDGDFGHAGNVIGNTAIGSSAVALDANYKRANCFVAGASGTVSRLTAYLSPTGTATGTQKIEGAIYSYSSGAPGSLLAQSNELSFPSTSTAGWYDLPLQAAISVASGTTYCLGLFTGLTNQVAAVQVAGSGGPLFFNPNTYAASGPTNPFGVASSGTQTMSEYAPVGP